MVSWAQVVLISGYSATPRSGSTLLNALLNQRPDVYMPFNSPFIELLWRNYKFWDEPEYNKIVPLEIKNARNNYCLEIANSFFKQCTDKKYVIDKHWMWIVSGNRSMYEDLYNKKLPVIYIHRSYDDIVESYKRVLKQGIKGKIAHIDNIDSTINLLNKIYSNQQRFIENNPDNIVYIEFDDWCNKTKEILKYIEVELGLEPYTYNLKNPSMDGFSLDTEYIDKKYGNDKLHALRDASVYRKRY
jgi:hypothetical protein